MEITFVHLFFNVYNSFPARPAVCGDGERPQIRAVIIIHCLRGIVASEDPLRAFCPRTYLIAYDYFWFDYLRDVAFGYRDGMTYCY